MFEEADLLVSTQRKLDLTPMIDVIFILLLFFVVTTTFAKMGIPLTLPEAESVTRPTPVTIDISIDKSGQYFYESMAITQTELQQLLTRKSQKTTDIQVVIRPDAAVKTQALVTVLDLAKTAEIESISIAADPIKK